MNENINKTILLCIAFIFCKVQCIHAVTARPYEFNLFLGGSYYIGDLNPVGHFNSFTKPAGGIGFRYNYNTRFAVRINIFSGSVQGDDLQSSSLGQKQRKLNFKSPISEYSFQGEFNFLDYRMNSPHKFFSTYAFLGIGGFKFKPQGEINGVWQELQPLSTEGQGTSANPGSKQYKLFQVAIPFGVGFKLNLSEKIDLALEWGMRKTFTDYLDDVSTVYPDPAILTSEKGTIAAVYSDRSGVSNNVGRQRGNSKNKDWYCFSGVVLGFRFREPAQKCPALE